MGGFYHAVFAGVLALALTACGNVDPLPPIGERIDGPYYLTTKFISADPGHSICYSKPRAGCDLRIASPVIELGWDEDFISAAVRKPGAPAELSYYYIVRDFDGPRADVKRVVRGPYDAKAFLAERRAHGVPGVFPLKLGPARAD